MTIWHNFARKLLNAKYAKWKLKHECNIFGRKLLILGHNSKKQFGILLNYWYCGKNINCWMSQFSVLVNGYKSFLLCSSIIWCNAYHSNLPSGQVINDTFKHSQLKLSVSFYIKYTTSSSISLIKRYFTKLHKQKVS